DRVLGDRPNQKDRLREDVHVEAADLIAIDSLDAKPTYNGLVNAVQVGIQYIEAWLRGLGAVAIHNLMEDAATAEISRSQLWQWIRNRAPLAEGGIMTPERYEETRTRALANLHTRVDPKSRWDEAAGLLDALVVGEYQDFLTQPGYQLLDSLDDG